MAARTFHRLHLPASKQPDQRRDAAGLHRHLQNLLLAQHFREDCQQSQRLIHHLVSVSQPLHQGPDNTGLDGRGKLCWVRSRPDQPIGYSQPCCAPLRWAGRSGQRNQLFHGYCPVQSRLDGVLRGLLHQALQVFKCLALGIGRGG